MSDDLQLLIAWFLGGAIGIPVFYITACFIRDGLILLINLFNKGDNDQ